MTDRIWLPDGFSELPCAFDRYELVEKLGEGGMAEVYRARKRGPGRFHKWVVVKRILPQMATSVEYRSMFEREAEVGARLDHAHIVHCYDYGEAFGSPFIVMEYVDGMSLRSVAERVWGSDQRVPLDFACSAVGDVALALDAMHTARDEAGNPLELVHRDVSGDNLVLARSGHVKLIDFGIAKGALTQAVTTVGELKGKLSYMAPEQARQGRATSSSDVFALGVTAYWLTTRRHPFRRTTDMATLQAVVDFHPPQASDFRDDMPLAVAQVIAATMEKDPTHRPTAAEVADSLYAAFPTSRMRMADVVRRLLARPDAKTAMELSLGGRAHLTEQHAVSRMSDELSWIAEVDDLDDSVFVALDTQRGHTSVARVDLATGEVSEVRTHAAPSSVSSLTEDDAPGTDDISGTSVQTPPMPMAPPRTFSGAITALGLPPVSVPVAAAPPPPNRRGVVIAVVAALSVLLLGVTVVAVDIIVSISDGKETPGENPEGDDPTRVADAKTGASAGIKGAGKGDKDTSGEPEPAKGGKPVAKTAADTPTDASSDNEPADSTDAKNGASGKGGAATKSDPSRSTNGDTGDSRRSSATSATRMASNSLSSNGSKTAGTPKRSRRITLDGPSRIQFSTTRGRRVGRGGSHVELAAGTTTLLARDKKAGATYTVPIVRDRASLDALGTGSLEIRVSPYANVRIGSKKYGVTPFAPLTLTAGVYDVVLVNDTQQKKERVRVRANKKTVLKVKF